MFSNKTAIDKYQLSKMRINKLTASIARSADDRFHRLIALLLLEIKNKAGADLGKILEGGNGK